MLGRARAPALAPHFGDELLPREHGEPSGIKKNGARNEHMNLRLFLQAMRVYGAEGTLPVLGRARPAAPALCILDTSSGPFSPSLSTESLS